MIRMIRPSSPMRMKALGSKMPAAARAMRLPTGKRGGQHQGGSAGEKATAIQRKAVSRRKRLAHRRLPQTAAACLIAALMRR